MATNPTHRTNAKALCHQGFDGHICTQPAHADGSHMDAAGWEWLTVDGRTYLSPPLDEMALAS